MHPASRPQLYEDLDEAEHLIKSPSEPWPSGLPSPWLGESIYQLPLDNSLEWLQQQQHLQQQQQQQQQQRQNLLRFSSSSSTSDELKNSSKDFDRPTALSTTKSNGAKRHGAKNGRKKRKSSTVENGGTTKIDRQTTLNEDDNLSEQQQQQPIYMEVEDSGYTEDSSTPSSGNNTNNINDKFSNVDSANNKFSVVSHETSSNEMYLASEDLEAPRPRAMINSEAETEVEKVVGAKNFWGEEKRMKTNKTIRQRINTNETNSEDEEK